MTNPAPLRPQLTPERPGAVERAYQLARQGKTLSQIRAELAAEHYGDARAQLSGPTLLADLRRLAQSASLRDAQTPEAQPIETRPSAAFGKS